MTALAIILAGGLLVGLVLARMAARGRRNLLAKALNNATMELALLGHIEAALKAYPFGEGVPAVLVARSACAALRDQAKGKVRACQAALAGTGKARL